MSESKKSVGFSDSKKSNLNTSKQLQQAESMKVLEISPIEELDLGYDKLNQPLKAITYGRTKIIQRQKDRAIS